MLLVVSFFFFKFLKFLFFLFFEVAMCDLVHNFETIFHLTWPMLTGKNITAEI